MIILFGVKTLHQLSGESAISAYMQNQLSGESAISAYMQTIIGLTDSSISEEISSIIQHPNNLLTIEEEAKQKN
ncbi:hypothetical protein QE152_g19109 [Popillia japonica]|uniref:Uncharacterized protein n=1 Tax=Popillia japonica TaxID=7064 RepID=A0AAW1L3A3_POPJA